MKNVLPKLSEGSFMWRIFVASYDHILWQDNLPVAHHAPSHMAGIPRYINLNLKNKSYFNLITEKSALCVHKQRRVHQKQASNHRRNQIELNKYNFDIDHI